MDVSLIFGIIFTIIVMGALIAFGWPLIADYLGFGENAQVLKSIDSLGKKIDSVYRLAEGSGAQFNLSFSKDYRLCFFNSSNPAPRYYSQRSMTWDPDWTTKYSINASHYNVWYYQGQDDAAGQGKKIPYLDTPTDKNFCAPGGTALYLEKKYDWVEVKPA